MRTRRSDLADHAIRDPPYSLPPHFARSHRDLMLGNAHEQGPCQTHRRICKNDRKSIVTDDLGLDIRDRSNRGSFRRLPNRQCLAELLNRDCKNGTQMNSVATRNRRDACRSIRPMIPVAPADCELGCEPGTKRMRLTWADLFF